MNADFWLYLLGFAIVLVAVVAGAALGMIAAIKDWEPK